MLVGEDHFGGKDFFRRGGGEVEFAYGQAFFGAFGFCAGMAADGRAEDAAGHGTGFVEVAEAVFGVEGRAGGFVGEVFEGGLGFFAFVEDAGGRVAGEAWGEFFPILMGAKLDGCGSFGVGGGELRHAGAETCGIERVNGEGPVAALGAAGAADEVRAAALGGVGEAGVDDLDELAVLKKQILEAGFHASFDPKAGAFGEPRNSMVTTVMSSFWPNCWAARAISAAGLVLRARVRSKPRRSPWLA